MKERAADNIETETNVNKNNCLKRALKQEFNVISRVTKLQYYFKSGIHKNCTFVRVSSRLGLGLDYGLGSWLRLH